MKFLKQINLSNLDTKAIVAFIMSAIAISNVILRMFNKNEIDIDEAQVYNVVSAAALIITTLYSMYRNFNVTDEAAYGQMVSNNLRDSCNSLTFGDVETLLNNTTQYCDTDTGQEFANESGDDEDIDNIDNNEDISES